MSCKVGQSSMGSKRLRMNLRESAEFEEVKKEETGDPGLENTKERMATK